MAAESPSDSFSSSPKKRLKTLSLDSNFATKDEINKQNFQEEQLKRNPASSIDGPDSMNGCGICLSGNGREIRGYISSCDHYFCFVCIMEWAKVESRCPMCKRRFSTIRRPPKVGVFPSERVVNVPERDQVYLYFGNTTMGPPDPYLDVKCNVCHGGADENLILLCDLCDSAAHTYCVGLGATVPEGDWFCSDCAVSRTEHDNLQKENDGDHQDLDLNSDVAKADVSIFDIVGESDNPVFARQSRFYRCLGRQLNLADEVTGSGERTRQNVAYEAAQTEARTLRRCRNVNTYIQVLRENWDALRSGSLSFPSNSVESSNKGTGKRNTVAFTQDCLDQPHTLSSTSGHQPTTEDGFPGIHRQNCCSHDIEKAWKMMNRAKSKQKVHERTKIVNQASKYPSAKENGSKELTSRTSGLLLSKSQQHGIRELERTEKQYKHYSFGKESEGLLTPEMKKHKQSKVAPKKIVDSSDNLPTTGSPGFSASVSSWKVQTSSDSHFCHENGSQNLQNNACRASSNVVYEQHRSADSDLLNTKAKLIASSSLVADVSEGKNILWKNCAASKLRKDDDAKSEIQSLVKFNLKLLSRDKLLRVSAFKEVARLATHTILAACGLGHSRHVVPSLPRSAACSHSEQIQQTHKSTLMPNSCRECFYVFVKDVVNSILSAKLCHAKS